VCGNCELNVVRNFRDEIIATVLAAPCPGRVTVRQPVALTGEQLADKVMWDLGLVRPLDEGAYARAIKQGWRPPRPVGKVVRPPTVGPKGPAGDSGASGHLKPGDIPRSEVPEPPESLRRDLGLTSKGTWLDPAIQERQQELGTYVMRHPIIGWRGEFRRGPVLISRWWRLTRRFTEYRASYVHLRYLEMQETHRVT